MKMGTVTSLQPGAMNDELRMTNTQRLFFFVIFHSSFVIFNPRKVPAPLFS
jgi:hypothetical protein